MKTSYKLLLVAVSLLTFASGLKAQEVGQVVEATEQTAFIVDNNNQDPLSVTGPSANQLRIERGQKIADTGKTLMIGGGAIALVGLPLYFAGKDIVVKNGYHLVTVGDVCESGSAALIDVGIGIPPFLSLDAVYGYNFNPRLFVGAGVGGKMWVMDGIGQSENIAAIPIYAQIRYTLGKGRISPYAAISGGYDVLCSLPYLGFDFGTRIRSTHTTTSSYGDEVKRDNSWWLSSKLGYTYDNDFFLSIGIARSF